MYKFTRVYFHFEMSGSFSLGNVAYIVTSLEFIRISRFNNCLDAR